MMTGLMEDLHSGCPSQGSSGAQLSGFGSLFIMDGVSRLGAWVGEWVWCVGRGGGGG